MLVLYRHAKCHDMSYHIRLVLDLVQRGTFLGLSDSSSPEILWLTVIFLWRNNIYLSVNYPVVN